MIVITNDMVLANNIFFNILGLLGALLTNSVFAFSLVMGSYPIGSNTKKIGHQITKKKIKISTKDIISALTQLEFH